MHSALSVKLNKVKILLSRIFFSVKILKALYLPGKLSGLSTTNDCPDDDGARIRFLAKTTSAEMEQQSACCSHLKTQLPVVAVLVFSMQLTSASSSLSISATSPMKKMLKKTATTSPSCWNLYLKLQSQILVLVDLALCQLQHLLPCLLLAQHPVQNHLPRVLYVDVCLHEHLEVGIGAARPVFQRTKGVCSKAWEQTLSFTVERISCSRQASGQDLFCKSATTS